MQNIHGRTEKGYKIVISVPTTIFDSRYGEIKAYAGEKEVDRIYFQCKSMPRWDEPAQAIMLSRRDEQLMIKRENQLLARLPDVTHKNYKYKIPLI